MSRVRLPYVEDPHGGLRVLAVDPFLGGSHLSFLEGLVRHSRHRVEVEGLPGRHWKWRMQGGAVELARRLEERLADGVSPPQVFFASDMLDVPRYLGLLPPGVQKVPVLAYFHENQLTYPLPEGVERDLTYAWTNVVSAWAADRVLFNSEYHRREFLGALPDFLAGLPDEAPPGIVDHIAAKSGVLHLGCDLRSLDTVRPSGRPVSGSYGDTKDGPLVVWNQRWEYDKNPARLFEALQAVLDLGIPFRLALVGTGRGEPSQVFVKARSTLGSRVVQWGRLDSREDYARLLFEADVVVSTALHEFFGAAVVEAIYCGCRPVLPRRLSYPELVPAQVHDWVLYDEPELPSLLAAVLGRRLPEWSPEWQRTWVARFDWGNMGGRYDDEISSVWAGAGGDETRRRYGEQRLCGRQGARAGRGGSGR